MSTDEFETREAELRARLRDHAKRLTKLRSKDREFHGLEREFRYFQEQMLTDFERSADLKHPRDRGDVREVILRKFLRESGYLPARYGVSDRSIRAVSPSGHLSHEIDIALYDQANAFTLMRREDVYAAYPVESIYGVIQVKSRLTRKELQAGLSNLASFKRLDRNASSKAFTLFVGRPPSARGFAILFAYTTDMKWMDIIGELESFAKIEPKRHWPNAVVVLDRGAFLFGEGADDRFRGHYVNESIEAISKLRMHGMPDRDGLCLYQFFWTLLDLLRNTSVTPPDPSSYFHLPLLAQEKSFTFSMMGPFAEMGHCKKHGDFARKIPHDKLQIILDWCTKAEPINWIKAHEIAYGNPEDPEAHKRQPWDVRIYNPENLPLSTILLREATVEGRTIRPLAYDSIDSAGLSIWIPNYYAGKEALISGCPTCSKKATKRNKSVK